MDIVIVGGGLAGGQTARALRAAGHTGEISLIAAEAHVPYERPPLSKKYLAGEVKFETAWVRPAAWYREHEVDLRLSTTATAVDRDRRHLTLYDGSQISYDALVLATGSQPRRLGMPGATARNVYYLRTVEDADAIRATFGPENSLVIIGGGWIGLEVAATAREAGTAVTVLERAEVPLAGVLGPELGRVFADLHRSHGTKVRTDTEISELVTQEGLVTGVRLADGELLPADAVVVGIGVTPEVTLAERAGLDVDNGVLVDSGLRTSDRHIWAVGDIANHDHPLLKQRVRVEHWATAMRQPATAAVAILGEDAEYRRLPYFFSDQYDLGMEYIGHAPPGSYTEVVIRGDLVTRKFIAFWLSGDNRVLAAMNVNVWDVLKEITPLIEESVEVDTKKLADPNVGLPDVAAVGG